MMGDIATERADAWQPAYPNEAAPVPLSFPSILRNPGIAARYAHLRTLGDGGVPVENVVKSRKRDDNEGKRWIRRKENAKFAGNPHIVAATKKDYALSVPETRMTFPEPLPAFLPRTAKIPPTVVPTMDAASANAGRFSLSLKGMRRELRKSGGLAQAIVSDVEVEIVDWLRRGGTVLAPREGEDTLMLPGAPIGTCGAIYEVSRSPLQLVWSTSDNAFARYIVHCCVRYHEIVSFSKDVSGERLTYLLRPNVTRPDRGAAAGLDTPPVTDIDYSSHGFDTESDRDARSDIAESDVDVSGRPDPVGGLASISEGDASSRDASPLRAASLDGWSVVGGSDAEGEESDSEHGLIRDVRSMKLQDDDIDQTPRPATKARQSLRNRTWDNRQSRSGSSPSRSPARRPLRRTQTRVQALSGQKGQPRSFYDYLFS